MCCQKWAFYLLDQCLVPKSDDVIFPLARMQLEKHGRTGSSRLHHCQCSHSVATLWLLCGTCWACPFPNSFEHCLCVCFRCQDKWGQRSQSLHQSCLKGSRKASTSCVRSRAVGWHCTNTVHIHATAFARCESILSFDLCFKGCN